MNKFAMYLLAGLLLSWQALAAVPEQELATLRGEALDTEPKAPRMAPVDNADIRKVRNYPMQAPVIPHKITGYQLDKNGNKCLSCHSRQQTEESQAPMISVTHYMDRDGNFLASVSPRRYFCTQCHVSQLQVTPLVENTFQDVTELLQQAAKAQE